MPSNYYFLSCTVIAKRIDSECQYSFLGVFFHSFGDWVLLKHMHDSPTFVKINVALIEIDAAVSIDDSLGDFWVLSLNIIVSLFPEIEMMGFGSGE